MVLESPALVLNINVQDVLGILEKTLKEKNWANFEVANLKLVYVPYYVFNYDVLVETDVQGQPFSQATTGVAALNAVNGKLDRFLAETLEQRPVSYEKEISHGLEYELQPLAITRAEVTDACRVKLAGQYNVKKENLSAFGFRTLYWPVWRIFVTLPDKTQRIEIDAVSGTPLNFEEVPEREKGWIEVTQDTIQKMKSPSGWAELARTTGSTITAVAKTAATKEPQENAPRASGAAYWLFHTKAGQYTMLLLAVLTIIIYFLYAYPSA